MVMIRKALIFGVSLALFLAAGTPILIPDDLNEAIPTEENQKTSPTAESPAAAEPEVAEVSQAVTEEERDLLARAVYSEARGEPFQGQVAIAAVILNRVEHENFPDEVDEVIFQPAAFTAVQDGQFWLTPDETAYAAVQEALEGRDPSGGATYYYNPATATSGWIFTREVITAIGKHLFAV